MAVDFPVATTVGETFDAGGITWTWNGTGWTSGGGGGGGTPVDAYTKAESDGRFVNVPGDTMTGNLNITCAYPGMLFTRADASPAQLGFAGSAGNLLSDIIANDSELILDVYDDTGTGTVIGNLSLNRTSGDLRNTGSFYFNSTAWGTTPGWGNTNLGMAIVKSANGPQLYSSHSGGHIGSWNINAVGWVHSFNFGGAAVGSISVTATATAYNTSSDERLKEDLQAFDAGTIIDATNVYDFAWKSSGERAHGVIAQQANEVYPEAVNHNAEHDVWGIDYSKYVPILLQELKALRARVAQLEAGA